MKPSKRSEARRDPEREEPAPGGTRAEEDRVDSIEGEEGNGGAYGRPRPADEDEKADGSRERG